MYCKWGYPAEKTQLTLTRWQVFRLEMGFLIVSFKSYKGTIWYDYDEHVVFDAAYFVAINQKYIYMGLLSDAQIIKGARLAVFNTEKDPEKKKRMGNAGFNDKRMQEGKTLLKNATNLKGTMKDQYEENWNTFQQLDEDQQAVRDTFMHHVVLVRAIFRKTPKVLHGLKIKQIGRKRDVWTGQALHFYTKLQALLPQVAPVGITQEVIMQTQASVEALIALKEDCYARKADAEDSTQAKRKAILALKDWLIDFRATARLAFKDNPQMLEAYGMKVVAKKKA